jgi:hypothetical protein
MEEHNGRYGGFPFIRFLTRLYYFFTLDAWDDEQHEQQLQQEHQQQEPLEDPYYYQS